MWRSIVLAVIALTVGTGDGRERVSQPRETGLVLGTVVSCTRSSNAVGLELLSSGTTVRVDITDKDQQSWPSPAYRTIVGDAYRVEGPCPQPGEHARVFLCRRCDHPTVQGIELGGRGAAFDEEKRTLWIIRQFFDRESGRETDQANVNEYWNYLTASMLLANHNRMDGGSRFLWMRDRLARTLDAYSSDDRAAVMIARFGRPSFREGIAPIRKIYAQHSDEVGLVRGVPYLPADPRSAPFVGSWPSFAMEVYVEQNTGTLLKLY